MKLSWNRFYDNSWNSNEFLWYVSKENYSRIDDFNEIHETQGTGLAMNSMNRQYSWNSNEFLWYVAREEIP